MAGSKSNTKSDSDADDWKQHLGPKQIGGLNYFFLFVCVSAQLVTFLISWPAWQARPLLANVTPNLPWIAGTPQFSTGILLVASLVLVLLSPRKLGMLIHLAILVAAMFMDQLRCQPQVLAVAFLMAGCVWPRARRIAAWYLIAMWTWAGVHKIMSPDWWGLVSHYMLSEIQIRTGAGFNPTNYYKIFAAIVAISEVATGLLAWLRPKLGAIACVLLHLGICGFLLLLDWNFSVLPWNLCTAIVGPWLIWKSVSPETDAAEQGDAKQKIPTPQKLRRLLPRNVWEKSAVIFLLLVPIGFYFGLIRHGLAHVLYSNNTPLVLVNRLDQVEFIDCWEELEFPFPIALKPSLDYFRLTGEPGESLHFRNQHSWLPADQYFRHQGDQHIRKISKREFLADQDELFHFSVVDDPRKIFQLELAGATMKRRREQDVVYAIEFPPDKFEPQQLGLLSGIPNIEQIQLGGCRLTDEDLDLIPTLRKLYGIGLDRTQITDEGLGYLAKHKLLLILEYEGTAISDQGHREFVESQTGTRIPE